VAIYAGVSNRENTKHLETQAERLLVWCTVQRWSVHQVVKECGSGVNDQRPRFLAPLADPTMSHIVVEHKDRAAVSGLPLYKRCSLSRAGNWWWSIRLRRLKKIW